MPHSTHEDLHLMLYPWLAFGHINSFVQLARKLAAFPGIRITFLSSSGNVAHIAKLLSDSPTVSILSLKLPHVAGLPPGIESTSESTPAMAELLKRAVDLTKPDVTELLTHHRPNAIVYEFAHPWMPSIARPLGVKALFFSTFSSVSTAYLTVPSRRSCSGEMSKAPPGFPATSSMSTVANYQANDFAYIFKSFNGMPCVYDRVVSCMDSSDAIIMMCCMEMEGPYINYVKSEFNKPVLLAGPVVPEPAIGELESHWEGWLQKFEAGSVVYCALGTEAILSDDSIKELLLGLEMVGLPFIVMINLPKGDTEGNPEELLKKKVPEGLEERVKGRGIVHVGWVQQQQMLSHKSVGCFICHCGRNSLMEGMVSECGLVMLPQFGDQFLNSALLAGDLGVGVEVERDGENGMFTREGVRDAVTKVMEDDKVKERKRKWKEFLVDEKVQGMFMTRLVEELKEMVKPCVV
ncbi:anthocyanidin-3-O-glucoside rhamnosyltransferase-like [Dioscorea cayenensis subsp. rotundata]|uniref:Anthocyanidin-3-O-glucoside rhamnosyltransferase-like n=1 Tax=Dioscorea cayennensis subsp. rotundata TaxID=55577 RepID=A0AB40BAJ9_DIOCR|nr:anthocyanidin-3-O-glucoside rhamnosyltransferase-like [Dioscorea cayenensis subsp. rotundata]